MTLYVDCDDTLAIYLDSGGKVLPGKHPYGHGADRWVPYDDLVIAVNRYHDETNEPVVIWSGGGHDYAKEFLDKLFPDRNYTVLSKDDQILDQGRMRIVDDDLPFREGIGEVIGLEYVFSPERFVEYVQERFGP